MTQPLTGDQVAAVVDQAPTNVRPGHIEAAHRRYATVLEMLAQDMPVVNMADQLDLSVPATYNLISRARRWAGTRPGAPDDPRPAGSKHSPRQYVRDEPRADDEVSE